MTGRKRAIISNRFYAIKTENKINELLNQFIDIYAENPLDNYSDWRMTDPGIKIPSCCRDWLLQLVEQGLVYRVHSGEKYANRKKRINPRSTYIRLTEKGFELIKFAFKNNLSFRRQTSADGFPSECRMCKSQKKSKRAEYCRSCWSEILSSGEFRKKECSPLNYMTNKVYT